MQCFQGYSFKLFLNSVPFKNVRPVEKASHTIQTSPRSGTQKDGCRALYPWCIQRKVPNTLFGCLQFFLPPSQQTVPSSATPACGYSASAEHSGSGPFSADGHLGWKEGDRGWGMFVPSQQDPTGVAQGLGRVVEPGEVLRGLADAELADALEVDVGVLPVGGAGRGPPKQHRLGMSCSLQPAVFFLPFYNS